MTNKGTTGYAEKTIGEIVSANYDRTDVFRKYGVDFCCGGKKSLASVCAEKGIPLPQIVAELESVGKQAGQAQGEFARWSVSHLIEYLLDHHHDYIRQQTPLILEYGEKVARTHGHAAPEAAEALDIFRQLADELATHLVKEETVLFPVILKNAEKSIEQRRDPFLAAPIHVMEQEHDHAGALLHRLEEVTSGFTPPEWACNTFRAFYAKLSEFTDRLFEHVHIENNILFPQAV